MKANYKKFLEVQEPFYQKGSWPPEALFFQRGHNPESEIETLSPDENGQYTIEIKELERLVIYLEDLDTGNDNKNIWHFPGIHYDGYLVYGDELKPLPVGSTLDHSRGVFYWQPGPGFLGEYRLFFFVESETGALKKLEISIKIISKF